MARLLLDGLTDMDTTKIKDIKMRYRVVGDSPGLNRALDIALQVAPTDLGVLIVGESGVGKDVIPRIIHDNSPRRRENYFAINCGSIPEGTIDSELFGHEKGSFTGAIGESNGYFGAANKGTLFLDEVGELPLATQARLLRVLENGEYIRVGGQKVMKTDVRIVAATNVNLQKAVKEGRFREDLYYRLNNIYIQMPALRDRGTDILLLFRLFVMNMVERYRLPRITLTKNAERLMLKYKWPGNIRQLKNVTEQMCILAKETEITEQTLLQFIPDDPESTALQVVGRPQQGGAHSYESEREILYKVLYELRGTVTTMRHEINELKKKLDDRNALTSALDAHVTSLAPLTPITDDVTPITDISNAFVEAEAEEITTVEQPSPHNAQHNPDVPENLNIEAMGRQMLEKALERNGGNRKRAAAELGISDRTLYRRLKQYDME